MAKKEGGKKHLGEENVQRILNNALGALLAGERDLFALALDEAAVSAAVLDRRSTGGILTRRRRDRRGGDAGREAGEVGSRLGCRWLSSLAR